MRDVCNVAHTLIRDRLEQQAMVIIQAALVNGVAPPDMDVADAWLNEWLEQGPQPVDRALDDWRAATGLRPIRAGG